MNDLLAKRAKQFAAWNELLARRKSRPQNPFHEPGDYRKSKPECDSIQFAERSELREELEAWEAASDEDFEAFESSLG